MPGVQCVICLSSDTSTDDWCALKECGHVFHTHCAVQALEHSRRCPQCRVSSRACMGGCWRVGAQLGSTAPCMCMLSDRAALAGSASALGASLRLPASAPPGLLLLSRPRARAPLQTEYCKRKYGASNPPYQRVFFEFSEELSQPDAGCGAGTAGAAGGATGGAGDPLQLAFLQGQLRDKERRIQTVSTQLAETEERGVRLERDLEMARQGWAGRACAGCAAGLGAGGRAVGHASSAHAA